MSFGFFLQIIRAHREGGWLDKDESKWSAPVLFDGVNSLSDLLTSFTVYKGLEILYLIARIISFPSFQLALHMFVGTHSRSIASTIDLRDCILSIGGRHLGTMMRSWLTRTGFPTVQYWTEYDSQAREFRVRLRQTGYENKPLLDQDPWMLPLVWAVVKDRIILREGLHVMRHLDDVIIIPNLPAELDFISLGQQWSFYGRLKHMNSTDPVLFRRAVEDPDAFSRLMAFSDICETERARIVSLLVTKERREAQRMYYECGACIMPRRYENELREGTDEYDTASTCGTNETFTATDDDGGGSLKCLRCTRAAPYRDGRVEGRATRFSDPTQEMQQSQGHQAGERRSGHRDSYRCNNAAGETVYRSMTSDDGKDMCPASPLPPSLSHRQQEQQPPQQRMQHRQHREPQQLEGDGVDGVDGGGDDESGDDEKGGLCGGGECVSTNAVRGFSASVTVNMASSREASGSMLQQPAVEVEIANPKREHSSPSSPSANLSVDTTPPQPSPLPLPGSPGSPTSSTATSLSQYSEDSRDLQYVYPGDAVDDMSGVRLLYSRVHASIIKDEALSLGVRGRLLEGFKVGSTVLLFICLFAISLITQLTVFPLCRYFEVLINSCLRVLCLHSSLSPSLSLHFVAAYGIRP